MILLNGNEVKPTVFPDKTSQVWKLENIEEINVITWRYEKEEELIHICQLRKLLGKYATLNVPYLPYARQDKEINNNSTFALRVFADIVNQLDFHYVLTFDVHSNLAKDLINNLISVSANKVFNQFIDEFDLICFPDHGARLRYNIFKDFCYGFKERDQLTGRIVKFSLNKSISNDKKVLVIDDLCDGGATFEILAKELEYLENKPSLYVSHGIFSKGTNNLRKYYDKIYTTDSVIFNKGCCQDRNLIKYESTSPYRLLQS